MHSLHAYFLRPGDPTVPILYEVDRIRDGRSFTTRRVVAIQHGRAIFNLQTSFHVHEEGYDHEDADAHRPARSRVAARLQAAVGAVGRRHRASGTTATARSTAATSTGSPLDRKQPLPPRQRVWLRADGVLPDDPVLHACIVTYASDMTLLDTTLLPHAVGAVEKDVIMASLDHAMWFHRPFRADEWLLYDQESPSASGGRGIARGSIFTHDGHLAVTVVQEGLIRLAR